MNIITRNAVKDDIDEIVKLYQQVDDYHINILPDIFKKCEDFRSRKQIEDWIENAAESAYILALNNADLIGFLNIRKSAYPKIAVFQEKEFALIENCVVREGCRRHGIGKKLFEAARKWSKERGLNSIQLTVWNANKPALKFYENLGFDILNQKMSLNI
jgi:diamine N-acetyltransferase